MLSTAFQAIDMGCPVVYITDACAGCSDDTEAAVVSVLAGLDYVQTTILDTAGYLATAAAEYTDDPSGLRLPEPACKGRLL